MEKIQFKNKITIDDFIDYNKWFFYEKNNGKRLFKMLPIIALLDILMLIFIVMDPSTVSIIFFIVLTTFFLMVYIAVPMLLRVNARKAYSQSEILQKENLYTIDDEGFSVKTDQAIASYKWDQVYMAVETKKNYFIFINIRFALIVSKQVLGNKDEQLRAYLFEKLNSNQLINIKNNQ